MDAPIRENYNAAGYLGSFLSNTLKTNQLEVNTDIRTLRPIARLKEPRDLFALPKERDNECAQQLPRWPNECQVLDERVYHIEYAPDQPEPYYKATGKELQPRPVGEEHGIIVYNYMPISAVHYRKLNKRKDQVRTYGRNEDHIYMVKIENDFEFWGDFSSDEIRQRMIAGREAQRSFEDFYFFNHQRQTREFKCYLCKEKIDPDRNRFNTFLQNNDIVNHTNHFDKISIPKKYENYYDDDTDPCWCNNMPQFSRSSVGGSKYLLSAQPYALDPDDLIFESRFESGNLARVVKVTQNYYELYLRPDMYTNRHTQWFYFRVKNTRTKVPYRFSIVNLTKPDSLYKEGMRPLMYSTTDATNNNIGWQRCGENIAYFRNDDNNIYSTRNYHQVLIDDFDDDDSGNICSFTLTFQVEFQNENDTVYFAHSYPYTYSDLQDYLMNIQRHPIKSKFCKLRLLCRSLAGNNIYYLTVTAPSTPEEEVQKKKKAVVITARVHPGEAPSSWMMKGFMDFITSDSYVAKKLRHKFIFKLVPMINPDGVIVGNTRSSLTGRDLNRQYRTVIRETYPSIWNTKAMIKRLIEDCGVALYCDMHAHSRKHNIFIYGCENMKRHPDRRLLEQVFPLMLHKNVADKFSFENCKFRVQKNKEGTGRIVVWVLGVTNSYTLEASFAGSTLGGRAGTHFSTMDYEHLGRAFCETLMDYYDDNPLKNTYHAQIYNELRHFNQRFRREFDETEAYLRHRERIHEREKREKLRRKGKLEEYLRSHPNNEVAPKHEEEEKPVIPPVDQILQQYKEIKKMFDESSLVNYSKFDVDETKVNSAVERIRRKKELKAQWAKMDELEAQVEDPDVFKPKMAGKTKMPSFFFSNLEKLRTKILTRLSKEGSSADEPLNIPLSDYSSDEGDSSSSSDDEGKDSFCDLEGPCCQTLRVPPSSPVLIQKKPSSAKKTTNKTKQRRRLALSSKRNSMMTRSFMDIPTTEPGNDFLDYYTTEDECETDYDTEGNVISRASHSRVSKVFRNDIRKVNSVSYDTILMPPELIITKVSDDNQLITDLPTENKTAIETKPPPSFTQNIIKEFPPISTNFQDFGNKTKSWHNFSRCVSTMKIRNVNCDTDATYQTAESLHFKLSLKKQIWTGTQSDSTVLDLRPLSYGAQSSSAMLFNKSIFYDSEALLTACSQKLAAWQENGELGLEKLKLTRSAKEHKKPKQQDVKASQSKNSKTEQRSAVNLDVGNLNTGKSKRRRSTITKLVDTADLISQLAKNTKSSSAKIRKPVVTSTTSIEVTNKVQKFKTSGLVATAVQARKPRKSFTTLPLQTLSPSLRIMNGDCNTDSEQENVKIPLKRTAKKSFRLFKESASRKLLEKTS